MFDFLLTAVQWVKATSLKTVQECLIALQNGTLKTQLSAQLQINKIPTNFNQLRAVP